jgi:DNA-directed RNA polymerase subunit beta
MPDALPLLSLNGRTYVSQPRVAMPLPDLAAIQKDSYELFFKEGLKELFEEISPVRDFIGRDLELYFDDYYLDEPKHDELTARARNTSFEAPLRVKTRLVNKRSGEIKEQEVYLGDFPLMTDRGTFIINGVERVVVSQLIRSAGVVFSSEMLKGRPVYGAKVIPNRGAWLEFETDNNGVIWVKIDRKRKVAATSLLRALGVAEDAQIKELFKDTDTDPDFSYIDATIGKDASHNEEEGLREVYRRIRPGDLVTTENARSLIRSMFTNFERYDFGAVGRYKLNITFGENLEINKETRVLRVDDLAHIIGEIIRLNRTHENADDIDHLGNRRVRSIGELVQNKVRIGLARLERIVKDRMSTLDLNTITPNQLINARPIISAIKEFFMSSQLSQFMDQTNPLAELEHKRRLSAMGPGGLSRERASFEVRDVHRTHYGRICPIATPEGPNIGLVGQLSSYARINRYGFIETPYRKVVKDSSGKPKVTDEVVYLDAFTNDRITTAAATAAIDKNGHFVAEKVEVRVGGKPSFEPVDTIEYMDVAPHQIVSIATALIPFVEHNEATRALMGSNMQRQAVSLVRPQAPIVGTGIEARAAADSGQLAICKRPGVVAEVHSDLVVVKEDGGETTKYRLGKFVRSNASTCMNQRPMVNVGDRVEKGQPLADGAATDGGELALGQNVLVAFMSWEGGNYEDAILLNERLVHDDRYSSIHIEDFTIDVRDTKLGEELVTRDIPNVSEEKLKDLDAEGVIRIGAQVTSGSILVGKITPKGETELSAEEKLLRAIFGEKAKDVRDSSLYLEHGEYGRVVDIKMFTKEQGDKLSAGVLKTIQVSVAQLRKIQVGDKMAGRHGNKGVISRIVAIEDMPFLADGRPVDMMLNPLGVLSRMNLGQIFETHLGLAAHTMGLKMATPTFAGILDAEVRQLLVQAGWPATGQVTLYDGRNGLAFENPVTIGYAYMLKLNHMVEDKIHQRSIGPYSLVTQQPLGGKAQFGGQRFGEMEVWALQAYGAAYALQEMLTIKSDDVPGRAKAYEAIIKNEPIRHLNVPEAFHVLTRELKGLGLDVELLSNQPKPASPRPAADEPSDE